MPPKVESDTNRDSSSGSSAASCASKSFSNKVDLVKKVASVPSYMRPKKATGEQADVPKFKYKVHHVNEKSIHTV